MSDRPSSKDTASVEKALSGDEPSLAKTAGAVATEPLVVDGDDGEESDTYDDFDHEENQDNDGFEDDQDDQDDQDNHEGNGAPPSKASLTALLLGNPSVANGNPEVFDEEGEEEGDEYEEDDGDFQEGDEDEDEDEDNYTAPASTSNGKKRSIGDLQEYDGHVDSEGVQTKKAKA